jgi:hypothetical protein
MAGSLTDVPEIMVLCSVEGCGRPIYSRDAALCKAHWQRVSRGQPVGGPIVSRSAAERFASSVRVDESGCWIWTGTTVAKGRNGALSVNGRKELAHRFSYRLAHGSIPDGLELDHLCRVPLCVNPAHLEPVTHLENLRRGPGSKTHCVNGHQFTPENTRRMPNGWRRCRACERVHEERRQPRRRAA